MGLRMDDIHAPTVASGPTSQPTTNGTDKKQSLQDLTTQKENIEAELSALGSVLDSHAVTMRTTLTTFDGYPRADIDIAQIRTTRARIIRLKNDHKALMAKVEETVHELFASGKASEAAATTNTQSQSQSQPQPQSSNVQNIQNGSPTVQASTPAIEPPFARVNAVVPNSPAEQACLRVGDKVTRFGSVNWMNHERLSKVAQVVQQNENRVILVKVLREASAAAASQPVELSLTPRNGWGGRGLLGCHLLPL